MMVPSTKISQWLGEEPMSEFELARVVLRGLPLTMQTTFLEHGITKDEFHRIVIPLRTYRHRKDRLNRGENEVLTPDESDKAVRAARVLALAEQVFANREKALSWMRRPKKRFDGDTPMDLLRTEAGARLVEEMLVQIDEGIYA